MRRVDPEDQRWLLRQALSVSVPLWMHELKSLDKSTLEFIARKCGAMLGEKGASLMFRVKRAGATASVFNDLARGIAAACLATGQEPEAVLGKLWP